MAHLHPVYDTDPHFSVDPITREITYLSNEKLVIVQEDHNSQIYTFEIPRYVDGHDMMLCDLVQIHYINIGAGGNRERGTGLYQVTDLQVAPDDENVVVCSWLISQNATAYVGSLSFVIRFACTSGSKIDYSWSTTVFSSVAIIQSIDNASLIVEQYTDVLQMWYTQLFMAGDSSLNMVYSARTEALEDIEASKNDALDAEESGILAIGTSKDAALLAIENAKNDAISDIQEVVSGISSYNGEVI